MKVFIQKGPVFFDTTHPLRRPGYILVNVFLKTGIQ